MENEIFKPVFVINKEMVKNEEFSFKKDVFLVASGKYNFIIYEDIFKYLPKEITKYFKKMNSQEEINNYFNK